MFSAHKGLLLFLLIANTLALPIKRDNGIIHHNIRAILNCDCYYKEGETLDNNKIEKYCDCTPELIESDKTHINESDPDFDISKVKYLQEEVANEDDRFIVEDKTKNKVKENLVMLNDGTFISIGENLNDEDLQPVDVEDKVLDETNEQENEDEDVFRIIETIDEPINGNNALYVIDYFNHEREVEKYEAGLDNNEELIKEVDYDDDDESKNEAENGINNEIDDTEL